MMSRLKQIFCLLLSTIVLIAGCPAAFADPAEGREIEDALLPAREEAAVSPAPSEEQEPRPEEENQSEQKEAAEPNATIYAVPLANEMPAGVYINENFDSLPAVQDAATRPIPYPHGWSNSEGELATESGWLVLKHKTGGIKNYQLDMPVMNGVLREDKNHLTDENGSKYLSEGKNYVEFTFRSGSKATQTQVYVTDSDGTNLLKFVVSNGKITPTYLPAEGGALASIPDLGSIGGINDKEQCSIKLLFDQGKGRLNLEQLWVEGVQRLPASLPLKATAEGGLMKVCFCPAGGNQGVGEEALAIDRFRVFASGLSVLDQKLQEDGAKLTFDDIKGRNESSKAVKFDLDFTTKTETKNGLKVMNWKSSEPSVVTTEGKVICPETNDCAVRLTPILGLEDTMGETEEGYLTADGEPISVVVQSKQGGAIEQGKMFEYKLDEPFDAPRTSPSTQPMPWINGWNDKNNTAEAVVKDGALWVNQTKGVCQNKYQMEIPFTYGYTPGGGSPQCGTLSRGDLFVDFSWITDPKTTEITYYLCSRNSDDAYTMSWILTYDSAAGAWKAVVRWRNLSKVWEEIGVAEGLDLYAGENSIRVHLDASQNGATILKGVWINGQNVQVSRTDMRDIGTGLFKLMIIPTGSQKPGDNVIQLTGMKVWENFEGQLAGLLQQKGEQLSFSDIAGANTDQNAVTDKLVYKPDQMSPSGNFKVLGWKADREDLVAADGTVTKPTYDAGDQQVVLTPVFSALDPENVDGTGSVKADGLPITITVKAMSAAESVQYVKENLSFEDIKGENSSASTVDTDLELISSKAGVQLAWELVSVNPAGTIAALDCTNGALTRPEQSQKDVTMTVKARLSCQAVTAESAPITFTVKKLDVSSEDHIKSVFNALTFAVIGGANENESQICTDLNLPDRVQGVKITWISSGTEIAADGTVNRPAGSDPPASVTLTAKLEYGAAALNKTFVLTVQPEDAENLAKNSKVTASVEGTAEELATLFDDNRDTALPIKASVKKFNLVFDLGETMPVSQMFFEEKTLEPGTWAVRDYTIDVSNDNSSWITVYRGSTSKASSLASFDPVLARYVRLNVTKKENGRDCALAEAAVRYQPNDTAQVIADADCLTIEVPERITGNSISLPKTGVFGSEISWSFSPSELISDQWVVSHPANDTNVTLIAEVKNRTAKEVKRFQRTVAGTTNGAGGGNSRPSGGGGGRGTTPFLPNSTGTESQVTSPPDNGGETEPFTDLGQAAWAKTYILGLYEKGIVSGKTESGFSPLDNVTREEFVKMLAMVFELGTEETDAFSDVEADAWYAPYIGGARAAGIVNGVADGLFGVGRNITRQDLAVMTWRAAEAAGRNLREAADEIDFADRAEIAEYAMKAVNALQRAGLLSGDENGAFRPEAYATRAETAKILYLLPECWNTGIGGN